MAFVDTLIEHSDADVVMVERRHRPGGHWLDSYPFVQLHQPSRYYGVNSTPLGQDRIEPDGTDAGFYERASGTEICGYYDEIMRHRFLASGRVRFFPMCDYLGDRRFRSRVTGRVTDVTVRRHVVDATYMASRVPATDPAAVRRGRRRPLRPGRRADHTSRTPPAGYVIVGGGQDRDGRHLLAARSRHGSRRHHVDPSARLVDPQSRVLPARAGSRTFEGVVLELEAIVASDSVEEVYERLEDRRGGAPHRPVRRADDDEGRDGRASGELEQLRRIENVVRLGHVERIELDRDHARARLDPDQSRSSARPLRGGGTERQPAASDLHRRHDHAPARHACQPDVVGRAAGLRRSTGRTTAEKNRLCPPTVAAHAVRLPPRAVLAGIRTEMGWQEAPDLQEWLDHSRLNLMSGLDEHADRATVRELQGRFFAALFPAFDQAARCSRHRQRHGNERGCSNRRRVPRPEVGWGWLKPAADTI